MGVYSLYGESIITDFGVSLGDILGRMEVIEILGVLVLEGKVLNLKTLETSLMWSQVHHQK